MSGPKARGLRYNKVFTRIWSSSDFRSMAEDERFAAIYLLTAPHRNTEGLFRLPEPFAAHDMQWTVERYAEALAGLEDRGFVMHDPPAELVWIVNAVKIDPPVGPKQVQGAVNRLAETPDSPVRAEFVARMSDDCPALAEALSKQLGWAGYRIDTVSIPHRRGMRTSSDTPSIAHTHTHTHTHAQPRPRPSEQPSSTDNDQELTAEQLAVVEVADSLIERLGIFGSRATTAELRYIERALGRGWTTTDLEDCAAEAVDKDPGELRDYFVGMLRKRANSDPEHRPATSGFTPKFAVPDYDPTLSEELYG